MNKNTTILVTGGTGFLGKSLINELGSSTYTLRILSRRFHKDHGNVKYIQGDIKKTSDCERSVDRADVVIHIAGEKIDKSIIREVNIGGTKNLLSVSLKNRVKRFIYISSTGVIGADLLNTRTYDENSHCLPKNDYERSKHEAEKMVRATGGAAMDTAVLRPTNIFGENDPNFTLLTLSRAIMNKRFAFIGGRHALINMVYVRDVANAIKALVEQPDKVRGRIFHISDTCSMGEFIDGLSDELDIKRTNLAFPDSVAGLIRFLLKMVRAHASN